MWESHRLFNSIFCKFLIFLKLSITRVPHSSSFSCLLSLSLSSLFPSLLLSLPLFFSLSILKGYILRRRGGKKPWKHFFFLFTLSLKIFHLDPILIETEPILYVGSAALTKQHSWWTWVSGLKEASFPLQLVSLLFRALDWHLVGYLAMSILKWKSISFFELFYLL